MRLSQQQLRFVHLLELNTPELEEAVDRELDDNPALGVSSENDETAIPGNLTDDGTPFNETPEQMQKADYASDEEIPFYRREARNASPDDERPDYTPVDDSESLYDNLNNQIDQRQIDPTVAAVAKVIVGNLDSNGYLTRPAARIADDLLIDGYPQQYAEAVDEALLLVRSLDPPGIGATDLRDCLLLQIHALPDSPAVSLAGRIIDEEFDAFSKKHTHRLISRLGADGNEIREAIDVILSLNPKPGSVLGSGVGSRAEAIIPDFVIDSDEGKITVTLNNKLPDLRIEESFSNAVRRMEENARSRADRKSSAFITSRYNDARDFIRLLRQRQETLFAVMTAIVRHQKEYFLTRDVRKLRPMMLKDIAASTGYDISVISRATANKYASTPWGIFPLRFFFSDSKSDENDEVTSRELESVLKELVENEDKRHPLSDEQLRVAMAEKGYDVARRTVSKYRDRCGIPVARLRKDL